MATRSGIVGPGTDRTDIYRDGRRIVLSVDGQHTIEAAIQSASYLVALVSEIRGPVEFVVDLRKISAFAGEARVSWQEALTQVQHRIDLITIVQGTALARISASAISLYTGIKVRFLDTLDQAPQATTL